MKNSGIETSKPNGVFCRKRSPASTPKASRIQSRRLTMPRWLLTTPFGRPVEPEV